MRGLYRECLLVLQGTSQRRFIQRIILFVIFVFYHINTDNKCNFSFIREKKNLH